jgi:hypothetical protein
MIIIRRIHKAGSTNRLAGFGQGFDESFSNYYRDKSKEWVNASEQVRPPPNKYRLARALGMAANVAILGSFAYGYFTRRRQTKNGKIIVERVKKR